MDWNSYADLLSKVSKIILTKYPDQYDIRSSKEDQDESVIDVSFAEIERGD